MMETEHPSTVLTGCCIRKKRWKKSREKSACEHHRGTQQDETSKRPHTITEETLQMSFKAQTHMHTPTNWEKKSCWNNKNENCSSASSLRCCGWQSITARCYKINQKTMDKLVKKGAKDPNLCPIFRGDSVALAEEQWHQLAGCLPPLGTAWVKRRGRDHPGRNTHCLAALYTSPGLQQSPCTSKGRRHWRNSWRVSTLVHILLCQKQQCRRVKQNSRWCGLVSTNHAQRWGNVSTCITIQIYLLHEVLHGNQHEKIDLMQFNSAVEQSFSLFSALLM